MKLSGGGGGRFFENTPKNVKLNIALIDTLVLEFKISIVSSRPIQDYPHRHTHDHVQPTFDLK